jgi:hypothetical protein
VCKYVAVAARERVGITPVMIVPPLRLDVEKISVPRGSGNESGKEEGSAVGCVVWAQ